MTLGSLWTMLTAAKVLNAHVTRAEVDRIVHMHLLYNPDIPASRPLATVKDIHDAKTPLLLREFAEALVRIAHLRYIESSGDCSSVAEATKKLVTTHLIPYLQERSASGSSSGGKSLSQHSTSDIKSSEISLQRSSVVQDAIAKRVGQLRGVFDAIAQSSGVPSKPRIRCASVPDRTVRLRALLSLLRDKQSLDSELTFVKALHTLAGAATSDLFGCMESEMIFDEFVEGLLKCALVKLPQPATTTAISSSSAAEETVAPVGDAAAATSVSEDPSSSATSTSTAPAAAVDGNSGDSEPRVSIPSSDTPQDTSALQTPARVPSSSGTRAARPPTRGSGDGRKTPAASRVSTPAKGARPSRPSAAAGVRPTTPAAGSLSQRSSRGLSSSSAAAANESMSLPSPVVVAAAALPSSSLLPSEGDFTEDVSTQAVRIEPAAPTERELEAAALVEAFLDRLLGLSSSSSSSSALTVPSSSPSSSVDFPTAASS